MERLDKIVASRTGLTRKEARSLIRSGGVSVDGEIIKTDSFKCPETGIIVADGKILNLSKHVYYMMNKPSGVICATSGKDKTVLDLIPDNFFRKGLFPAGRLDKDAEGFVLITDNGDFAHKILSPKNHVPKRYYAALNGEIPDELPFAFSAGLDIGNGDVCSPADITIHNNSGRAEAEITIYEGMYHQVKRMFRKFSLEVVYLKRLAIGGLYLDPELSTGEVREILHKELEKIVWKF